MNRSDKLCLVVPCFNEESILEETIRQLLALLDDLARDGLASGDSGMPLVDDGSSDRTWEIIVAHSARFPGRSSLAMILLFLGSFQLLSIGCIGEYIAKIYLEVKHRLRYLVQVRTPAGAQEGDHPEQAYA